MNSVIWETCPLQTWKVYSFLFHADQTSMSEAAVVEFFNNLTDWLVVGLEHLDMALLEAGADRRCVWSNQSSQKEISSMGISVAWDIQDTASAYIKTTILP